MRGFLVTGTDTGVGKTRVACQLAESARAAGLRVGVMKPAETGCAEACGVLQPEDAGALAAASRCELPLDLVCPYRYRSPLAPAVAAAVDGLPLPDLGALAAYYGTIRDQNDLVLVEGAGGIRVPLTWTADYADLAATFDLEVVVVIGNRLGCLNASLLTIGYAKERGLRIGGYVLNDVEPTQTPATRTNEETLRRLARVPFLGHVSFGGRLSDKVIGALMTTAS